MPTPSTRTSRSGFAADAREYGTGAQVLSDLGIRSMRLLTNNPTKRAGLEGYGLPIVGRVPLPVSVNPENLRYLPTKRDRMGHDLDGLDSVDRRAAQDPANTWASPARGMLDHDPAIAVGRPRSWRGERGCTVSGEGRPELDIPEADGLRVGVVATRWHADITDRSGGACGHHRARPASPTRPWSGCRGRWRSAVVAAQLATDHDAVVALGVVIRGGTRTSTTSATR